jgi:hypothetical protein
MDGGKLLARSFPPSPLSRNFWELIGQLPNNKVLREAIYYTKEQEIQYHSYCGVLRK